MMRFLRKGDCYALEKPIKKNYYQPLYSFKCLLLSLSAYCYQFSCNVQESRASGTTGYAAGLMAALVHVIQVLRTVYTYKRSNVDTCLTHEPHMNDTTNCVKDGGDDERKRLLRIACSGGRKSNQQAGSKQAWSMASVLRFNTLLIHCYYFTHTWLILRPYTKSSNGRDEVGIKRGYSRLGLLTLFCVLSSFASVVEAQAQELRQGGATESDFEKSPKKTSDILKPKVEYFLDHNINIPLGSDGNGMGQVRPIAQSMLTRYQEGIKSKRILASPAFVTAQSGLHDMHAYRIGCYNCTLEWLFQLAFYDGKQMFSNNRTLFEVADSTKFLSPRDEGVEYNNWLKSNLFTYESVLPFAMGRKSIYDKMRNDLSDYFPQYHVSIEKRPVECLLLVDEGDQSALINKSEKPHASYSALHYSMSNTNDLDYFVERLHYFLQHEPPLINKSAVLGNINIDIKASLSNLSELNDALKAYGLQINRGVDTIDMLVIRDSGEQPVHNLLDENNYNKQERGFDWEKLVGGPNR